MAKEKRGLGRGLDALFVENATEDARQTVTLRVQEIEPNRDQPRKRFDEEALAELAASIAQHGVLQPLLVRPLPDGKYQLVAGERRWRAARAAGLNEVPVIVREMAARDVAQLALIENLQREDLNALEEARGYQTLIDAYGLTQEDVASSVNKSRPAVTNALRLLSLSASVMALVEAGALSAGHARAVLAYPPEAREEMAQKAVDMGLTVRALERGAKAWGAAAGKKHVSRETKVKAFAGKAYQAEVELALTEHLGRRVQVKPKSDGGTLEIEFYNEEDLRALVHMLSEK